MPPDAPAQALILSMPTVTLAIAARSRPGKGTAAPCAKGAAITSRPSIGRWASIMRVPMVRQSRHGGRWATIRYALDSNERTFRLCLIWVVLITSPALAAAIVVHCGPGAVRAVMQAASWFPPSFR
jgi:hypothetical protein